MPACEHAVTGAPQIVPDHSACKELFEGTGLLIPTSQKLYLERINTCGALVRPEDVAEQLNQLYYNRELYDNIAQKCYNKFMSPMYEWKNIAKIWRNIFEEVCST